ncbi:hypothetical protein AC578_5559 [Pseudocercospora eumusae]|uniref:Uncharacterized protein n=1 Tax=Pseudocercospora eumusae TaxID=321146 RepID=A0A139GWV8_9PEZI|nr:hypothetical protein AC578_5559 [Pseudocercospora eumusae]
MFSKQVMLSTALAMALHASANVVPDQSNITFVSSGPSATTWVHSFIPEPTSKVITAIAPTELNNGYAATVLRADPCDTVLAVTCTATGPGQACAGQTGQTTIMNVGPTRFELDYATQISGTSYSITQKCDLHGPMSKKRVVGEATSANCHKTTKALQPGGTEVDTVIWQEMTQLPTATITIIKNADDLPDPTATCDKKASYEIPTNVAAPTSVPEVYKVLVPVGAALVAGVGAMV